MLVWPVMVTPFCSRHPWSICTCGPITQKGPISTSEAISAFGSTIACGETRITPSTLPSSQTQFRIPLHGLGVHQHEFDVRLGRQFVLDKCLASDVTGAALDANRDRFEDQLVTRHDRMPHLHLIHAEHHRD